MVLPLTDLLCTKPVTTKPQLGLVIAWSAMCQRAFKQLKMLFTQELVFKHPDLTLPFVVQADASDVAVGVVLLQMNDQGRLQPCAYTSQKLTLTESGWAIWEKESFAV